MAVLEVWIEMLVIEDGCIEWARRALAQEGKRPMMPSSPSFVMNSDEEPISSSNPDTYPDSFFLCEEKWEYMFTRNSVLMMLKTLLLDYFLLPKVD